MDGDTFIYVVWGVVLFAILVSIVMAYRARRLRAKRSLLMSLFNAYFRGEVSADQLGQRVRRIVSRRFMGGAAFYATAVSAFQFAVETRLPYQPRSDELQKRLFKLLADLKVEFGLTDRYQVEGWRAGRE